MGVPCPGCGRSYDVTLFQFGRTIDCTCGRRVRIAPIVRPSDSALFPRFTADAMLGRLARWLRIIGVDALFSPDVSDAELARQAWVEQRVVLTRDRALSDEWSIPRLLHLASEAPLDQLAEVVEAFALEWRNHLFTRCSRCNAPLQSVDASQVEQAVPSRVRDEHQRFKRCPGCGRVYWHGSHVDRIRRALEAKLG